MSSNSLIDSALYFDELNGSTTATWVGTPLFVDGREEGRQAARISGTRHLTKTVAGFDPSNDFTVVLWARFASVTGSDKVLLAQEDGTGTGRGILYYDSDDATDTIKTFLGAAALSFGFEPGLDDWNHYALRFYAEQEVIEMLRNGVVMASLSLTTMEAADGDLVIGASKAGTSAHDGPLSEVGVWDRVLTNEEIISVGQLSEVDVIYADALHRLSLQENSGTSMVNSGTSGDAGTAFNMNLSEDSIEDDYSPGTFDRMLDFDGNNDNIAIISYTPSGAHTKIAWTKADDTGHFPVFGHNTEDQWFGWLSGGTQLFWRMNDGDSTLSLDHNVDPTELHMIAAVYTGTTMRLAVDGEFLDGSLVETIGNSDVLFIGRTEAVYADGLIAECSIWNRALTSSELKKIVSICRKTSNYRLFSRC